MNTGSPRCVALPPGWVPWLVAAWVITAWSCSAPRPIQVVTLRDPLSPGEHVALGVAYEREGKQELAKQEYEAALRSKPDHVEALVNLGNLAAQRGALAEGEAWYRRAVRVGGRESAPAANNLAWLYLMQDKRLASAESLARRAIAWDAKPEYADTLVHILIRAGKPIQAGQAIDDAIDREGDEARKAEVRNMFADETQAVAHLAWEQGKAKLAAEKPDQAESLVRKAIAWDPQPDYAGTLVDILIVAGKPIEAGRAIDAAVTNEGSDPQRTKGLRAMFADRAKAVAHLAFEQSKAKLAAGKYDEAELLIREAIKRDGERATDYLVPFAEALLTSDRPDDAVRIIDEGQAAVPPLASFPEKSRVLARVAHARSKVLLKDDQLESAEVLVRGALRWDPARAPHYLDTLAQVLIAQDKPYEAGKVIDEADSLAPVGDADLRARLFDRKAELFASQGLTAEAKGAAQQAEAIRKAATP